MANLCRITSGEGRFVAQVRQRAKRRSSSAESLLPMGLQPAIRITACIARILTCWLDRKQRERLRRQRSAASPESAQADHGLSPWPACKWWCLWPCLVPYLHHQSPAAPKRRPPGAMRCPSPRTRSAVHQLQPCRSAVGGAAPDAISDSSILQ